MKPISMPFRLLTEVGARFKLRDPRTCYVHQLLPLSSFCKQFLRVYRASNLVKVRTSDGRRKLVAVGGGNPSEDSRGEHFGGAIGAHEGGAVWSLTYSGDTGISCFIFPFLVDLSHPYRWCRFDVEARTSHRSQPCCRQFISSLSPLRRADLCLRRKA